MSQVLQTAVIAILLGLSSNMSGSATSFIYACFKYIFFRTLVVTDTRRVAVLDHKLGRDGICTTREVGPNNPPANGIHFLWGGNSNPLEGVIATRSSGERPGAAAYILYCYGGRVHTLIQELLLGNINEIMVRWIGQTSYIDTTTQRQKTPTTPHAWQLSATNTIVEAYRLNNFVSVLITGPVGVGKSRLAEFVAVSLRDQFAVEPVVVKGFDPTLPTHTISQVVKSPTWTTPYVIVLDEYDIMVNHAVQQLDSAGDHSLAKNRSSFLGMLDRINLMTHVILIATTNKAESEFDLAYIRDGRFNLRLKVDMNTPLAAKDN